MKKVDAKIIFLGSAYVGKTSIIKRIVNNQFDESYQITLGFDFVKKQYINKPKNLEINFHFWDTGGLESFDSLTTKYLRNPLIVIFVYDNNIEKIEKLEKWYDSYYEVNDPKKTGFIVCGNKTDLYSEDEREILKEKGKTFAEKIDASFCTVSAKNNDNIDNLYYCIYKTATDIILKNEEIEKKESTISTKDINSNNKEIENKNFNKSIQFKKKKKTI